MSKAIRLPMPAMHPDPPIASEALDRVQVQVLGDEAFIGQVDAGDLARAVAIALQEECPGNAEVTLVIADDETVAVLNRQYRGIDGPTDVLSFATQEPAPGFVSAPGAQVYLGDVIIALPFAQQQATQLGRALSDELRLLAVHGALHLLGYDHGEPDDEARMWARQDEILARVQAEQGPQFGQ